MNAGNSTPEFGRQRSLFISLFPVQKFDGSNDIESLVRASIDFKASVG